MITKERIKEILQKRIAEYPAIIQKDETSHEIDKLALKGLAAEKLEEALERIDSTCSNNYFLSSVSVSKEIATKAITEYRAEIGDNS